jgi:DNA-binding protein YbaB
MIKNLFAIGLCAMVALASCSKDDDAAVTPPAPKPSEPKVVVTEDFATATKGTVVDAGADLWVANENFTTVVSTYQALGSVKVGSSSKAGSIETKELDLSANSGVVTIKFKVKGWYANAKVTVSMGDETKDVDILADKAAAALEEKTVTFTKGTKASKIKFTTPMVAKSATDATLIPVRFFIDDIQVIN